MRAMCGTFPIAPCIHADPARAGVPGGRRIAHRSGADSGTRDGGRIHPIVLRDGGGTRGLLRSDQRQPSLLLGIQWPGPAWRRHDDRPVNAGGGSRWAPFPPAGAGFGASCGVTTDHRAYCWGDNRLGELGDGTTTSSPKPVAVGGGHTFSEVRTNFDRTCGLSYPDGRAYCWGFNDEGQLGTEWHERQPPSQHSDSRTGQPHLQPDNDRRSTHLRCDHRPQGVLLGSQH